MHIVRFDLKVMYHEYKNNGIRYTYIERAEKLKLEDINVTNQERYL